MMNNKRIELTKEEIVGILKTAKTRLEEGINLEDTQKNENLLFNLRNHHNNIGVILRTVDNNYDKEMTKLIVETLEQVVKKEKENEKNELIGELPILHPILLQAVYGLAICLIKEEIL